MLRCRCWWSSKTRLDSFESAVVERRHGLHPLRGQNNVQGASDAGLIPMMLPDYQHVSQLAVRTSFEKAWKLPAGTLDAEPGLTVVEVMHAIKAGGIRGMYVQGENPAMSDPDANHAREALAGRMTSAR